MSSLRNIPKEPTSSYSLDITSVSPTVHTMTSGTPDVEKFMDIGKNPKNMKKQELTPEQENFYKEMGRVIDSDLAVLLKDFTPEQIMQARIVFTMDKKNLALTIKIELPTS